MLSAILVSQHNMKYWIASVLQVYLLLLSMINSDCIQVCSQIYCCMSELSFLLLFSGAHISISSYFSKRDGLLAKLVGSMFNSGQMKIKYKQNIYTQQWNVGWPAASFINICKGSNAQDLLPLRLWLLSWPSEVLAIADQPTALAWTSCSCAFHCSHSGICLTLHRDASVWYTDSKLPAFWWSHYFVTQLLT